MEPLPILSPFTHNKLFIKFKEHFSRFARPLYGNLHGRTRFGVVTAYGTATSVLDTECKSLVRNGLTLWSSDFCMHATVVGVQLCGAKYRAIQLEMMSL